MSSTPFEFFDEVILRIASADRQIPELFRDEASLLKHFEEIKEAIYLASPDLYSSLLKYYEIDEKRKEGLLSSLYKYVLRMSRRTTPFGLFSGVVCGTWGEKNELGMNSPWKKNISLDYIVIFTIYNHLISNHNVKIKSKWFLNNTIHISDNKLKLVRFEDKANFRKHIISEFEINEPLRIILENCQHGSSFESLVEKLVSSGAEREEADQFINVLIDSSILISIFHPHVYGTNYLEHLLKVLDDQISSEPLVANIKKIGAAVESLNASNNFTIDELQSITQLIHKCFPSLNEEKNIIKIDQCGTTTNQTLELGENYKNDILDALVFLGKVNSEIPNQELNDFKKTFQKRYEYSFVPLTEVLDPASGIKYGSNISYNTSPLIDDIPFPVELSSNANLSSMELSIGSKLIEASKKGQSEIRLDDIVESLPEDYTKFDDTLQVLFRVLPSEKGSLFIENVGGNSASLFARFTYADSKLEETAKKITSFQQDYYNGKILAEISHLPDDLRSANVIHCNRIRDFEIPIVSSQYSSASPSIYLSDLLIAVKNNRVILFSKEHQKEVIPFTTHMLRGTVSKLPFYRFLYDVAHQNQRTHCFSWQFFRYAQDAEFLPRVKFKKLVFSPAIWSVSFDEFKKASESSNVIEEVELVRKKRNLPPLILINEFGDNELLIDLKNIISLRIFLKELKKLGRMRVAEYLFQDASVVSQNESELHSQFVALLRRTSNKMSMVSSNKITEYVSEQRRFPPGSEWIYYKAYCSEAHADHLLLTAVQEIVFEFKKRNWIDKWFFVRFVDEDFHIRIRFHAVDKSRINDMIGFINEKLSSSKIVRTYCLETYIRELERYGENRMPWCEKVFSFDSDFSLAFISLLNDIQDNNFRWFFAIKLVDIFLTDFQFTEASKIELLGELKNQFNEEFGADQTTFKSINGKLKLHDNRLVKILDETDESAEYSQAIQAAKHASGSWSKSIGYILSSCEDDKIKRQLASSHIHMMLNRIFVEHPRKHEMIVYNLMWSLYKSRVYRNAPISLKG